MKNLRKLTVFAATLALALTFATGVAHAGDTFTGEVLDKACYDKQDAHGPDHAECAHKCIEDGGEIALLTADGEVILLKADAEELRASLADLAGYQANVTGEVSMEGDMKVVTVTAVEEATT